MLIGLGGVDGRVDMYMQSRLTQLDSAAFLARLVRASRQDPNQKDSKHILKAHVTEFNKRESQTH